MDASKFFEKELKTKKRKFDAIILDPRERVHTREFRLCVAALQRKIIYVSCKPATLARDLKYLPQKGAK